jgi:predicted RNA polymerase sigma factor
MTTSLTGQRARTCSERIGRLDDARDAYDRAVGLADEDSVRRWLLAKQRALEATASPAGTIRKGL